MADSEPPSHGPTFTAFITTCNIAPIPPYIPLYLAVSPDHLCIPPSLSIYHCIANPPVLFNFLSITLSSLWCLHLEVRQWRALKWERRVIEGEEVLGQRKTGISCSQIGGKRHKLCFMEATGGLRRKKFTLWLTLSFFILIGMTKARQNLVYDVERNFTDKFFIFKKWTFWLLYSSGWQ